MRDKKYFIYSIYNTKYIGFDRVPIYGRFSNFFQVFVGVFQFRPCLLTFLLLATSVDMLGSLTLAHSRNSQMSFMYGFFFVKFLFFTVVCVVIMI